MKGIIHLVIICISLFKVNLAQSDLLSKNDVLDSLIKRVESSLSQDWFVVKKKEGFDVFFCRSCNEQYLDSMDNRPTYSHENIQNGIYRKYYTRTEFFTKNGADSVCYYSTVSMEYSNDTNEINKGYQPNDILKISVNISPKWNDEKYAEIQSQNNQLKNEIIKESLGKTNTSIFADYRYWIPTQPWLLKRIKGLNFSFEQLPYSSDWFNYSIFIVQDKPCQFCKVLYCNPKDKSHHNNKRNDLEHERAVALYSIAYALGIKDYQILN